MSTEKDNLIQGKDSFLSIKKTEGLAFNERFKAYESWKTCPAPSRRDEYWKYTLVSKLLKKTYSIPDEKTPFKASFDKDEAINLVFVNGIFSASDSDKSDVEGLFISDLQSVIANNYAEIEHSGILSEKNDYFSLLNDSFYLNGPFIRLDKNCVVDKPIRIIHVLTEKDRLINIKGLFITGENSSVKVVETWEANSSNENLLNTRYDIQTAQNSSLELIKIQSIGERNNLISQEFGRVERDGKLSIHTISTEGNLIRNNINISLAGEGGECHLNGLFLAAGEQHIDNHTQVDHDVPHCYSNELYKGILNDNAKGVFNGKVIVKQDAQKTNAFQYNGNLLLSDEAQIYSKPELEIYADDVKCSHGSTTGQMDKEALFYLESRGISKEKAKHLLVYAFAKDVLEKISILALREKIDNYLSERYHLLNND